MSHLVSVSDYAPTILVEIFANEAVNGITAANNIIELVKTAIEDNIVKKQASGVATSASYVDPNDSGMDTIL